jgi:hypothetical protein
MTSMITTRMPANLAHLVWPALTPTDAASQKIQKATQPTRMMTSTTCIRELLTAPSSPPLD